MTTTILLVLSNILGIGVGIACGIIYFGRVNKSWSKGALAKRSLDREMAIGLLRTVRKQLQRLKYQPPENHPAMLDGLEAQVNKLLEEQDR